MSTISRYSDDSDGSHRSTLETFLIIELYKSTFTTPLQPRGGSRPKYLGAWPPLPSTSTCLPPTAPVENKFLRILALKVDIWWHQISYFCLRIKWPQCFNSRIHLGLSQRGTTTVATSTQIHPPYSPVDAHVELHLTLTTAAVIF